jgi:branched-subunit amino acid transport protein
MSVELVALAVLMAAVTYPSRAVPLLVPGVERLPGVVAEYLRLLGPATLAALAAVSAVVVTGSDGQPSLHLGIEAVAVLVCVAIVAWRRNLLLGILLSVAIVAVVRALGWG